MTSPYGITNPYSDEPAVQLLYHFLKEMKRKWNIVLRPDNPGASNDYGFQASRTKHDYPQSIGTADILYYSATFDKSEATSQLSDLWTMLENEGFDMSIFSLERVGHGAYPCIWVTRQGIRQIQDYMDTLALIDAESKGERFTPEAPAPNTTTVLSSGEASRLRAQIFHLSAKLGEAKDGLKSLLARDIEYANKITEGRTTGFRHHQLLEGIRALQDKLDED